MKRQWVKLVIASSIDGRIAYPGGGKTQLGQEGDRLALEESLAWADGILMGGQTLRDHQSICIIKTESLIKQRILEGKNEQPISLIASNKANFSKNWPFFRQPVERWLLQKKTEESENQLIDRFHKHINLKLKWSDSLKDLNHKGLSKIVLLGGAKLISNFLIEDLIDELQITITPHLVGGNYCWVSANLNKIKNNNKSWFLKESKRLGNNELLIRYLRNTSY